MLLGGCANAGSVTFHPTTASFEPSPRASVPPVYRRGDVLPKVRFHSVGIIEVRAGDVVARAATKGQELGCWAVIEHALFEQTRGIPSASDRLTRFEHTLFAHGGLAHGPTAPPPLSTRFDCVTIDAIEPAANKPSVM